MSCTDTSVLVMSRSRLQCHKQQTIIEQQHNPAHPPKQYQVFLFLFFKLLKVAYILEMVKITLPQIMFNSD